MELIVIPSLPVGTDAMSSTHNTWAPADSTGTSSSTAPRCQNCGGHVTPQFVRVFGDNDDTVHACPNCSTCREVYAESHVE